MWSDVLEAAGLCLIVVSVFLLFGVALGVLAAGVALVLLGYGLGARR